MLVAIACLLAAQVSDGSPPDSLKIGAAQRPPRFDGSVDSAEWGAPTLSMEKRDGPVLIWLQRWEDAVYLAARIPDSTFYWGDDLVIGIDTRGDRAPGPQHDDFQWYLRRVMDSSVVFRGGDGHWLPPQGDPDWKLGPAREGGGWAVASRSDASGWSVVLRLDLEWFAGPEGRAPGMAFRSYDDGPNSWFIWPRAAGLKHPTELERMPSRWAVVLGSHKP